MRATDEGAQSAATHAVAADGVDEFLVDGLEHLERAADVDGVPVTVCASQCRGSSSSSSSEFEGIRRRK